MCLRTQLAHELTHENLGRGQVLLDQLEQLGAPVDDLADRVATLRDRVRTREAREAKLAALEHAQDWRVSARHRVAVFVLALGLALALWRVAVRDPDPQPLSPVTLALYTAIALGVLGVLVVAFRRHLFATAVTRRLVLGVLCCVAAMAINRAASAIVAPPTAAILSADMMLGGLGGALAAIMLARWFWLIVPLFVGGAFAARLAPEFAGTSFAIVAVVALAVGLVASARPRSTT